MPDGYPRRSLRKRLCQAVALLFSGIGVLYGVIECFAVDVGSEFLAAEAAAAARGIPCACIDVDLNRPRGRGRLRVGVSSMPGRRASKLEDD